MFINIFFRTIKNAKGCILCGSSRSSKDLFLSFDCNVRFKNESIRKLNFEGFLAKEILYSVSKHQSGETCNQRDFFKNFIEKNSIQKNIFNAISGCVILCAGWFIVTESCDEEGNLLNLIDGVLHASFFKIREVYYSLFF